MPPDRAAIAEDTRMAGTVHPDENNREHHGNQETGTGVSSSRDGEASFLVRESGGVIPQKWHHGVLSRDQGGRIAQRADFFD